MGLDGLFLYGLKNELSANLTGAKVDKIHQPSKDELVVLLRHNNKNVKLLISVKQSSLRIHLTEQGFENPSEPPMFCMLLRKHLQGARFNCFQDTGFERIAIFCFDAVNELGDAVVIKLAVELIGKQTNIILIGSDDRIIDALRRSNIESGDRMILPGARYTLPEKQDKLNLLLETEQKILDEILSKKEAIAGAIVSVIDGVSPLIARELCAVCDIDTDALANSLSEQQIKALNGGISLLKASVLNPKPSAILGNDKNIFEFSFMEISQFGNLGENKAVETFSELLELVFSERDKKERVRVFASDLAKLLSNSKSRLEKKIAIRKRELLECEHSEKYRIYGELLKANMHLIVKGAPFCDVPNYYDAEMATVRIPLDITLSPQQNAQKYFKKYRKLCNAAAVLEELITESEKELQYIESVIDELLRAQSLAELKEIRLELQSAGYIRSVGAKAKVNIKLSSPLEVVSPDGFKILIGRNNRQNDELTLKIADKEDLWFHTKNIPGSHVILLLEGKEPSEEAIMFAAKLAAEHSKAAESSSVPVDYTKVKFIKKPAGSKPGMVIYKTNKTVYVTPGKEN